VNDDRGIESERVVVRDRRRIDPVTGDVRVPAGEQSPAGTVDPAPVGPDQPDQPELAALAAQLEERTADLQRLSAEYANYRRRVDRDREAVVLAARAQFVGSLLTVVDDLDRAAAHGDLTGAFKLVADKLVETLSRLGLEPFGAEGEPFDPAVHEAVQHSTSAEVDGPTVAMVMRPGYRIADRVLRPAMVAVTDREESNGATAAQPATEDPAAHDVGSDPRQ
jgi:molecular chaperone GrpE